LGERHPLLGAVANDDVVVQLLEQFSEDYAPQVMQLPVNYRCPAGVVTLANNLVPAQFPATLRPDADAGSGQNFR
jgi:hypothetical protein